MRLKDGHLSMVHDASKIARVAALIKPRAVILTADDFGLSDARHEKPLSARSRHLSRMTAGRHRFVPSGTLGLRCR